jgi:hypothetical protein
MVPKAAGITWFKNEDAYKKALLIFDDARDLPSTYQAFLLSHAYAVEEAQKRGFVPVKAEIDPDTFLSWCGARDIKPDRHARMTFANEVAADYLRSMGLL